jgi:hypothetical protein
MLLMEGAMALMLDRACATAAAGAAARLVRPAPLN